MSDEKRLEAAGWTRAYGDYWMDPDRRFILHKPDAVLLLDDTPTKELARGKE